MGIITWDIYEIDSHGININGIMLRGRIRKFGLENDINILVENTTDKDNSVRFAIILDESPDKVINYIKKLIDGVSVTKILDNVKNPVLSKLKVNIKERYTL